MSLEHVRRIADEVAGAQEPALYVLSASTAEGGSDYTEVTVADDPDAASPSHLVIGLNRARTESAFRASLSDQLRQRLAERRDLG